MSDARNLVYANVVSIFGLCSAMHRELLDIQHCKATFSIASDRSLRLPEYSITPFIVAVKNTLTDCTDNRARLLLNVQYTTVQMSE